MAFTNPPDGWSVLQGAWSTDIIDASSSTLTRSGNYSIQFKNTATAAQLISSNYIPINASQPLHGGYTVRCSDNTKQVVLWARAYDYDFATIDTYLIHEGALAAADTWYSKASSFQLTSDARYLKLITGKKTAEAYTAYVDRVFILPSPVWAQAYRATTNQSIPATTLTKIQFNATYDSSGSDFDTGTNYRFTAPRDGLYHISGMVYMDAMSSSTYAQIHLYKNGSSYRQGQLAICTAGISVAPCRIDSDLWLDSGDYIELYAYQSDSVARNALLGSSLTYFDIHELVTGN